MPTKVASAVLLRPCSRVAVFVVPLVALAMLLQSAPSLAQGLDLQSASVQSSRPFDLPQPAALQSSPRLVFAHYMPSLEVSIDNKPAEDDYYTRHYLSPIGEQGKHASYGGFLRDRPLPRTPRPEAHWRLLDMESEVRQAIESGIDGFSVDILHVGDTGGRLWDNVNLLLQAAANVDPAFKIMLMPDMASSLKTRDPATLAKYMAQLGSAPSAFRLDDGRLVISPFLAENHPAEWWAQFLGIMRDSYATPVAFVPVFLNERPHAAAFAPLSYGMSNWGSRNPAHNDPSTRHADSPTGRIARVHALGKLWMQPVSVQDVRPRSGIFDEAQNTQNLRNSWQIAIEGGAEWVQLTTWNDYAEGTQMAPSAKNGRTYLDISAYYLSRFKTGAAAPIVRDTAYLTHRTHPVSATPTFAQTKTMTLRPGSSPARDTVEVLSMLTAPGVVTITIDGSSHSCAVAAGVDSCIAPLAPGRVSASISRDGIVVATAESPHTVTATPYVQDLEYAATTSIPTAAGLAPVPGPVPGSAPCGAVLVVPEVALCAAVVHQR